MCELFLIGEPVKAHVLLESFVRVVPEGIKEWSLRGHLAPYRSRNMRGAAIDGQSVLITQVTILENILAHLTQVEIQIAAIPIAQIVIHERVKQPELDILDAGLLEVGIDHHAHDTTPSFLGMKQVSVLINIGAIKVVRATLTRVERQIERLDHRRLTVVQLAARVYFIEKNLAGIGIGQSIRIILDITGSIGRIALCEQAVNNVPRQQRAVLATGNVVVQRRLGK